MKTTNKKNPTPRWFRLLTSLVGCGRPPIPSEINHSTFNALTARGLVKLNAAGRVVLTSAGREIALATLQTRGLVILGHNNH